MNGCAINGFYMDGKRIKLNKTQIHLYLLNSYLFLSFFFPLSDLKYPNCFVGTIVFFQSFENWGLNSITDKDACTSLPCLLSFRAHRWPWEFICFNPLHSFHHCTTSLNSAHHHHLTAATVLSHLFPGFVFCPGVWNLDCWCCLPSERGH